MPIHEFELFHGAVLTKLVRNDRPIALRLIETRPSEAWGCYKINDEFYLLVKYCTTFRKLKTEAGATAWTFVFSPEQMRQLRSSGTRCGTYVALVAGCQALKGESMHICLLEPTELEELLDLLAGTQQSLTIKFIPGKKFRVSSARVREKLVSQGKIDKWEVPGS